MNNVVIHTAIAQKHKEFEQQYLSLRRKEGRLYTDAELIKLPLLPQGHPLRKEWKLRGKSASRLVRHISVQQRPLSILEIGCGNGWLSNQLAQVEGTLTTGVDINEEEVEQAKRVFTRPNLQFLYGDIRAGVIDEVYDVIVFAASFQYFKNADKILKVCFNYLKDGGEVHIIDTQFYELEKCTEASKRSRNYFAQSGFPQMEEFYFHHSLNDLSGYDYNLLFNPDRFFNKLLKGSPFPWVCITK
jgi:2-polyprenyl-3-methyl-5-hydroxy-6-metoxy-1,4-benzoquinol methylase